MFHIFRQIPIPAAFKTGKSPQNNRKRKNFLFSLLYFPRFRKKFPFRSNSANSAKVLTIKSKPPKDISSKSWVIFNVNTMGIVFGKKHHYPREIASLTKIMTCYLTLILAKRMNLSMNELNVRVTRLAASMSGTSAELKEGDQLKLIDLLYGLMLPSGNDASFALGEALGCLLYYEFNNRSRFYEILQAKMICVASEPVIDPMKYFLNEMNKTAKELKLFNTTFANPHGLMNRHSKSTASDVAKLSCVALKMPVFLQIVNSKHYDCVIRNQKTGSSRKSDWFNTNKLLDKGFFGVKTGITPSAGPCLVTSLKSHLGDKTGKKEVWAVVVILNCRTMEKRWGECEELLGWGVREIAKGEECMGSARDLKHN